MSGLAAAFSVLMVGHSLFGPAGPPMLQGALNGGGATARVEAQIINGAPLIYNWDQSHVAEGVDARQVLPQGRTTHLILTEAVPLENHLKWSSTVEFALAFATIAASANPDVTVYVQETWHSLNSGTGIEVVYDDNADIPWRDRLDADLAKWEGIVEGVRQGLAVPSAKVALIPAGQAMALLHDEIQAGTVTELTDIAALFADDIHLNDRGHYFVAMVQYATLTGASPVGLPANFKDRWGTAFDLPDAELAADLQRIAWDAVQAYGGMVVAEAEVPAPQPASQSPAIPRAPPTTPLPDFSIPPPDAVPGRNDRAIGLAPVADWSTQQPFINVMKTARPWIGHKPGQWGGMSVEELRKGGFLDDDGWPLRMPAKLDSIGTLVLTDMPEAAVSLEGRYRLRFEGQGVIEVSGRAKNVRYGKGEITFDYAPGPGSVDIRYQRINPQAPPRITSLINVKHTALFENDVQFNPAWTSRIGKFSALRFMDWMQTNNTEQQSWSERPKYDNVTWAKGVPVEAMVLLANELGVDAWFNMPHMADDAYVHAFATQVRQTLDPKLKVYVEYSNEVWNWQFDQAQWADAKALERWDISDKWVQYQGLRAAEVAGIWSQVFAGTDRERLVNVIATHTGWLGLEDELLNASLVQNEGLPAPAKAFDAYAITGYFGGIFGAEEDADLVRSWLAASRAQARNDATSLGLTGQDAEAYIADHRYDLATALAGRDLIDGAISGLPEKSLVDLVTRVFAYHAKIARDHDLDLVMYEGGTHIVGLGPLVDDAELTEFFHHLNYSAEMGQVYDKLLEGWRAIGGQLFNAYSDVYRPTKWGSWGALRHLDDRNPRWNALVNFQ